MTLTIQLTPEIEGQLSAQARVQGVSVEDYIRRVLEQHATNGEKPVYEGATPDEWVGRFLAWANAERPRRPPLSDEAISRESIYQEREDAQL